MLGPMGVGDEFVGTTQVVGWRRVWARRRTDFVDGDGRHRRVDARRLGPSRRPGSTDPRPEGVRRVFWAPETTIPLGRVVLGEPPPTADRASFEARPQELDPMDHVNNAVYADWLDEQVIARRWHRRGPGDPAARSGSSTPARSTAAPRSSPMSGATGPRWSCRLADPAGNDLLRARLEAPGTDRR